MRKQKYLGDLMAQVAQLRTDNNQILTTIMVTTQHFLNVEAREFYFKGTDDGTEPETSSQ
ncbi:hypothetical protein NC653_005287 [Populus alba x Populus x berolinensis]|uniref:Uncharacterized protein n=1 Tax=Populus alba x Populus x berolinensis TaxID=444605 RepID=A0AAD6RBY8_9ROSI|nr:hypothetical protein NC653_005287 [Populus alba x Populus x berolinensis]